MALTSTITRITKRNGSVVAFEPEKIKAAIEKAFVATRGGVHIEELDRLATDVIHFAEEHFADVTPSVEGIQNVVEKTLMENDYFDVAKHYIIYRYEHTKQRVEKKQEVAKKIESGGLYVIKRDGQRVPFSMDKLKNSLKHFVGGFENIVNVDAIAEQCRLELHDDMPTKDIARSLIMVIRPLVEQDPAYARVAARILLSQINKDLIGRDAIKFDQLDTQLRAAFAESIKKGVACGRLDPRLLAFDIPRLAKELVFDRDELLDYMAVQTLVERYFVQDPVSKEILENPQFFWMRASMGLALSEKNREEWATTFYHVMSDMRYTPSTPTLFHAGTAHPQMSSCYLNTVEDSLDHIFKVYGDNAQLSKWSGGIGTDWTNLRGTGALIRGTGVSSQGTVPFLKIANDTTVAINRSGKRRGATCAYMELWHWDVEDFLELRKNTGDERRRTHDMDTAVWIPDLFMERVRTDGNWTLFSPDETPELHHVYGNEFRHRYEEYEAKASRGEMQLAKTMNAKELWKKMVTMLFETGHPWMTWKDPSNIRSPQDHAGVVHCSNLCTEITLNTSADETAVCNLGSVNFANHVVNGVFDQALVENTVRAAMRMLDNVIDLNFYPTKEAKGSNMRHRPVGLGIMGFQDALYKLNIPFDSDAAVRFADSSMEVVSYFAILTSSELAKERGRYQSYRGSKWDRGIFPVDTIALLEQERGMNINVDRSATMDWTVVRDHVKQYGMRNSNCMAIAPTATISTINGTVPSIEPIYKNIYVKSNQTGDFIVVNQYLIEDLKQLGLWDFEMLGKIKYHDGSIKNIPEIPDQLKEKYKETFDIDPRWGIKQTAHRGKWIDQSQSFNIFYGGKSGKEISDIYMFAWEMGLKTTYYLRSLGASQVEKSTVDTKQFGATHERKQFLKNTVETNTEPVAVVVESPKPMPATVAAPEVKLCRLDDPTCESCQ